MTLADRWTRAWADLGVEAPGPAIRDAVLGRYLEPHRAYHTPQHLEECFAHLDRSRDLAERPGEVAIAIWFHDAIYDTHASDNEARSASWAAEVITQAGGQGPAAERVRSLILATRHDAASAPGDATLLVDIDLAILGASEARFAEYEGQVRREFSWVPLAVYRATRARILRRFLARPRIYGTARFHDWFEAHARVNLQRSIAALGG